MFLFLVFAQLLVSGSDEWKVFGSVFVFSSLEEAKRKGIELRKEHGGDDGRRVVITQNERGRPVVLSGKDVSPVEVVGDDVGPTNHYVVYGQTFREVSEDTCFWELCGDVFFFSSLDEATTKKKELTHTDREHYRVVMGFVESGKAFSPVMESLVDYE
jgi:hypothetical protein